MLLSSNDHVKSEKEACEQRIIDLERLLEEKSSSLTCSSEKIKNMNDILQRNETRLGELEVETKSLEGKLREQESKVDHLHTNLVATELKLEDSLSKITDLCAEVETKTVQGSQLREVSSCRFFVCSVQCYYH